MIIGAFELILNVAGMLFAVSLIGYILVVIKEKIYLRQNLIVIDNKSVTQEYIDETDLKEFIISGTEIRAGDEVKIILSGNKKMTGIIIGANKKENSILMVTHDDQIRRFNVDKIQKLKIISKYGKFFKSF
jgi:uncharacterized Zn ribbon protein